MAAMPHSRLPINADRISMPGSLDRAVQEKLYRIVQAIQQQSGLSIEPNSIAKWERIDDGRSGSPVFSLSIHPSEGYPPAYYFIVKQISNTTDPTEGRHWSTSL